MSSMIFSWHNKDSKEGSKKMSNEELMNAQKKYEKICEKLDTLNDRAFELEQEMMFLRGKKQ